MTEGNEKRITDAKEVGMKQGGESKKNKIK